MFKTSNLFLLLAAVTAAAPSTAEEIVLPLEGVTGPYDWPSPARVVQVDAGTAIYRVDALSIEWSGGMTAAWGLQGGTECAPRYFSVPVAFVSVVNEDDTFAWVYSPTSNDYPNTESFSSRDAYRLFSGRTWEALRDGRFSVSIRFDLNYSSFCTLEVIDEPSGALDAARVIIEGARVGDFDGDGDLDAEDRESMATCHSGINVRYVAGCEAADFDLDGDVDCTDWDRFGDAWTEPGSPAPFLGCQVPVLELTLTQLLWTPVEQATGYDVVLGSLDALRDHAGDFTLAVDACLADDHPASPLAFGLRPLPGQRWWFLVRAVAGASGTTYDTLRQSQVAPRDVAIDAAAGACP